MQILEQIISTLLINGFHLNSVNRLSEKNAIINVSKYDKIGAEIKYSFLLAPDSSNQYLVDSLGITSKELLSTPVIISNKLKGDNCKCYDLVSFEKLIGGITNTGLILIPEINEIMNQLGHNQLPDGLDGDADDLLEVYVKECFQYILYSPGRRFGSDRLFESLPDGVIIGKSQLLLQFDTKAYRDGFNFSADDIERFSKYISEFNEKYSAYLGRIHSFIVVSGHFNDSEKAIQMRSAALYEKCNTNLSVINAEELGKIVKLTRDNSDFRASINFKTIFKNIIITEKIVSAEINKTKKDNII